MELMATSAVWDSGSRSPVSCRVKGLREVGAFREFPVKQTSIPVPDSIGDGDVVVRPYCLGTVG
jgi:hypothetical protein